MLDTWDEMIEIVGSHPGMFVGRPRYALVCSFFEGFGAGRRDDVLKDFQRSLSDQPKHRAHRNYVWSALVLDELFPDRRVPPTPVRPEWETGWPRPADAPMSEDDLRYPDEDDAAVRHLFLRLREFLESEPSRIDVPRASDPDLS